MQQQCLRFFCFSAAGSHLHARTSKHKQGQHAHYLGSLEDVAAKILRHAEAPEGITRLTFMMDTASLSHERLMKVVELMGTKVKPMANK